MLQGLLHFTFDLGKFQDNLTKTIRYLIAVEKSAQQLLIVNPRKLAARVKEDTSNLMTMNKIRITGPTQDIIDGFKVKVIGTTKRKEITISNELYTIDKTYIRIMGKNHFVHDITATKIIDLLNYGRKEYTIPGPNIGQANAILKWTRKGVSHSYNWKGKGGVIKVPAKEGINFLENVSIVADEYAEEIRAKIKDKINNL